MARKSEGGGLRFGARVASILTGDAGADGEEMPSRIFDAVPSGTMRTIPLDLIDPRRDQPRQSRDTAALSELAESVRMHGVLQPIRVRPSGAGRYEIVAGERRWTAAGEAGLRDIPAQIVDSDDDRAFVEALVENVQREDLNAVDRARALVRLRETLGSQSWADVGQRVGIGRRHVHRLLNLAALPERYQDDIRAGALTEKHARALLLLRADPARQQELWEQIHGESLSGDAAVASAQQMAGATPVRPTWVSATARLQRSLRRIPRAEIESARPQLTALRDRLSALLEGD